MPQYFCLGLHLLCELGLGPGVGHWAAQRTRLPVVGCGHWTLDSGIGPDSAVAVTTECMHACMHDVCHYCHYHCHYCHSCHHCHYKGLSSTTAIATMSSWSIHYCLNHCFFDSFIRSNITSQVQWNTSQVQWDGRISNRPTVIGAPESTKVWVSCALRARLAIR